MDLLDATAVMAQVVPAFQHFKGVHPHASLMMSREAQSLPGCVAQGAVAGWPLAARPVSLQLKIESESR